MLLFVGIAVVLSMATWFSATAITPVLIAVWQLSEGDTTALTVAVQVGFVVGALTASATSLFDVVPLRRLMAISAIVAALTNLSLLAVPSIGFALAARFLTGMALAGIYPPALKLISTWFVSGRGAALGALIGALTLGSASPHLVRALAGQLDWRTVVMATSAAALVAAALLARFAHDGPHAFARTTFDRRQVRTVLANGPLALVNLGYFGHMWELYAMWGWFLAYASVALPTLGYPEPAAASILTFGVIAVGVIGAWGGGILADRYGRTATAALMMAISGTCALAIGFVFDGPAWLFTLVAILWGISIIGDSAQFSAMVTEVSDTRSVGTALALQLGLGFALTIVSIRLTWMIADSVGWRWSFLSLAPGPLVGVAAMMVLRRLPEANRIAGGLR